jgi:hypothetical protein
MAIGELIHSEVENDLRRKGYTDRALDRTMDMILMVDGIFRDFAGKSHDKPSRGGGLDGVKTMVEEKQKTLSGKPDVRTKERAVVNNGARFQEESIMAKRGFTKKSKNLVLEIKDRPVGSGDATITKLKLDGLDLDGIKNAMFDEYGVRISNRQAKILRAGGGINLRVEAKKPLGD